VRKEVLGGGFKAEDPSQRGDRARKRAVRAGERELKSGLGRAASTTDLEENNLSRVLPRAGIGSNVVSKK